MKKFAIGCGVLMVLVLGLFAGGLFMFGRWAKDALPDVERSTQLRQELDATYATPAAYVPPVDGVYAPDRVALFVDLRERLHPSALETGAEIDAIFERALADEGGGLRGFFGQMGSAFEVIGGLAHHAALTDSLLLDAGMGRGEFMHLQLVLTRGWLDLDARRAEWDEDLEAADGRSSAIEALRDFRDTADRRAGELLRQHLDNVIAALGPDSPDSVRAYVDGLDDGDRAYPFTDPVPPSLAAAFDDHVVRLRQTAPKTFGAWIAESTDIIDEEGDGNGPRTRIKMEF